MLVALLALAALVLLASCHSFAFGNGLGGSSFTVETQGVVERKQFSDLSFTSTFLFSGIKDSGLVLYQSNSALSRNHKALVYSSLGPAMLYRLGRVSIVAGVGLGAGYTYQPSSTDSDGYVHIGAEGLLEGRYHITERFFMGLKGTVNYNLNTTQGSGVMHKTSNDIGFNICIMIGRDSWAPDDQTW